MNRKQTFLTVLLSLSFYLLSSQVPQGFNYQAIARDASGNPIANATIKVKLSILSDTTGFYLSGTGTYVWEEEQTNVKTNASGLFTLVFGTPSAVKIQGSATSFSAISWSSSPLYIGTKIANPTVYKTLGAAQLWTVPYSMLSGGLYGSPTKFTVRGNATSRDSALFEVKNVNGETVFAVYDEGVRVFVGDGLAKGATKGGFAIGELSAVKTAGSEYFRVTRDSTRVYVNPNAKGLKGGFAIGDLYSKSSSNNYLNLTTSNYLIGQRSGMNISTGLYNSFLGYESGKATTAGNNNVFMGYISGSSNTSGNNNVFIGNGSGFTNSTNSNNVFLGYYAGYTNTADNNLFIGTESGRYNSTGTNNTFLGYYSGRSNTTGNSNVLIGNQSGAGNTTGYSNVMIGDNAGYGNSSGYSNIIMGRLAGFTGTNNQFNIFMGDSSGYFTNNQFATRNVFIGYASGKNTQSYNNIFIGNQAGWANSAGQNNIAIGDQAGYSNNTSQNIFIGTQAGKNNTSGSFNIFVGRYAGLLNTTGAQQILIGGGAGGSLTSGSENVIIGVNAGAINSVGNQNVFLGNQAGWSNTGSGNVIIGYKVGYGSFQTASNRLIIDNYSVTTPLIWGEFDNRRVVINGTNTDNTSNYTFFVKGSAGGSYAWNSTSDARLKKNISEITDALNKVILLRGVSYEWADSSSIEKGSRIGFIAQEVDKVVPQVVNKDGQFYSMQYAPLTALIVEAMKEQQKIINNQKSEIENLNNKLNAVNERLEKLESRLPVASGNK